MNKSRQVALEIEPLKFRLGICALRFFLIAISTNYCQIIDLIRKIGFCAVVVYQCLFQQKERHRHSSRLLNLKNWNRIHFLGISHMLPCSFPNKLTNFEWTEPTFLQSPWILQMLHCNCEYSWKTRETSKKYTFYSFSKYLLWF